MILLGALMLAGMLVDGAANTGHLVLAGGIVLAIVVICVVSIWLVERREGRCDRCDHQREAHEHYRDGTDCSVAGCGCQHFRG